MTTDFESLIRGKTVALVGPAMYMNRCGWGREIDAHDTVVRINRGIESIDRYAEDVGTRTDVLYSCLIERAQQTGKLDPDQLADHYHIKWIVAPPESDMKGIARSTKFHGLASPKKVKNIMKRVPIRLVDHEFHTSLAKKVQCKPNTGFLAIYDLLRLDPKYLSIYGFSFYLDGFLPGQKSGVEKEKNCTEQEFADMAFNSRRHVQVNMWSYAKETLPYSERIKTDPVLTRILELSEFSRKAFEANR